MDGLWTSIYGGKTNKLMQIYDLADWQFGHNLPDWRLRPWCTFGPEELFGDERSLR